MTAVFLAAVIQLRSADDEYYYKINKSFETYGAIFKEISFHYVEDIDPEELVRLSIEGMLGKLDPYTVYYDEEEVEDLELLTYGSYNGLGITVGVYDSMLTIVDVEEGFPAENAGLRIGDHIYKIGAAVVLNESTEELRQYTRGEPGTEVDVWVLRDGISDTLHYTLKRDRIRVSNVSYSGYVGDGIGYIKLERFSQSSAQEFLSAFNRLREGRKLEGLIIDVRDNPGGLLESAVSICEMFVPRGSVIVSTRGRNFHERFTYKSLTDPEEPELPLVVLINGRSASASEILAGAMQDLDRGVIVGQRSYGKGLVQSVFELPYNSTIKITTSKYYTPSGRSIQKIDFANLLRNKESEPDTSVFYTKNHRKVLEYKGIMPDTAISEEEYSDFIIDLFEHNHFFEFANIYTSALDSLPADFEVDAKVLDKFSNYLNEKDFRYESPLEMEIERIREIAEENINNDEIIKLVKKLEKSADIEESKYLEQYKEDITEILEAEILRRLKPYSYVIGSRLDDDRIIRTARQLLTEGQYKSILAGSDDTKNKSEN